MDIDERFPTKLDAIQDAPEPFRKALLESFPAKDSVRFLVHAPALFNRRREIVSHRSGGDQRGVAGGFRD